MVSSPASPQNWSKRAVPTIVSGPSVPATVAADAVTAQAASARSARRSGRSRTDMGLLPPERAARVALCVVVAVLAREDHLRDAAIDEHTRLDRQHAARTRRLERVGDRTEARELLEVLDRREDEHQLVVAVKVERLLGAQPAPADALAAVDGRVGVLRRLRDEEVGVEADLHLPRRDPAREAHQLMAIGELDAGLLLELADGGRRLVGVLRGGGAPGEHPRAAHEPLLGVALDEQHLGTGVGVAQDDQRRRRARLGDRSLVELLARRWAVDPHRRNITGSPRYSLVAARFPTDERDRDPPVDLHLLRVHLRPRG